MRRYFALSATLTLLVLTALCLTGGIAWCAEIVLEDNITYRKAGDTDRRSFGTIQGRQPDHTLQ